jgi:hypothetical protein
VSLPPVSYNENSAIARSIDMPPVLSPEAPDESVACGEGMGSRDGVTPVRLIGVWSSVAGVGARREMEETEGEGGLVAMEVTSPGTDGGIGASE